MTVGRRLLKTWQRRPTLVLSALAVLLAALEVSIDGTTWIELDVSIVYGLPLILATASRSRRLLWSLTSALVVATFIVYFIQIPPGRFSLVEPFFVNRVLCAVAMLFTAGLGHIWIRATEALHAQGWVLKKRNEELAQANRELVYREELIVRQNEELECRRRQAEETSGRKSQILAAVSHDIRTPINTISLLAEAMRLAGEDPAVAAQIPNMAERLQVNAQSVADLVSDLLDLARMDAGQVNLKEDTFSLNDLLTSQCGDLARLARAKALRLETDFPDPSIRLRTDRRKLSRVFSNLIGNAIKFTEAGGVTVGAARSPQGEVLIAVRDTGIGIAAEQLDQIFDEFAQVHKNVGDRGKGWGLGLAICHRLINTLGGAISVESALGQGSVFTVRLPSRCIMEGAYGTPDQCHCANDHDRIGRGSGT